MYISHDPEADTLDLVLNEPAAADRDRTAWVDLMPGVQALITTPPPAPGSGLQIGDAERYQAANMTIHRIRLSDVSVQATGDDPSQWIEPARQLLVLRRMGWKLAHEGLQGRIDPVELCGRLLEIIRTPDQDRDHQRRANRKTGTYEIAHVRLPHGHLRPPKR